MIQMRLAFGRPWVRVRDADPDARALYLRHYSARKYRDERARKKFVGPGQYIALMTPEADALFVWKKFIDDSGQQGVNCAVFRLERPDKYKASELILAAETWARERWPGERFYTYVNPRKVKRKRDPGRCFRRAGWKPCGETKGRLLILEKEPR